MPRIPSDTQMSPALFGVMSVHPGRVIARHWDKAILPILLPPRQRDEYELMASLCLIPGRELPQEPAVVFFVDIWLYNEPALDGQEAEVRHSALRGVARVFWDVIEVAVASNGGGRPDYDAATGLWTDRRKDEIRKRAQKLQNWISQPEE